MAIKVIAQLREVKLGKNPGKKFVMRPDLYVPIKEKKVFRRSEISSLTYMGSKASIFSLCQSKQKKLSCNCWLFQNKALPLHPS